MSDRDPNHNLNLHAIVSKVDETGAPNAPDQQQQQGEEKADADDQRMAHARPTSLDQQLPYSSSGQMFDEHDNNNDNDGIVGDDGEVMASMPPSSLFAYASGSLIPTLDYAPTSAPAYHESQQSLPPNGQQRTTAEGSARSLFGDASISLNSILDSLPIPAVGHASGLHGSSDNVDEIQGQAGTTQAQDPTFDADTSGRSHPTSITNSNSAIGEHGDHANADDDVSNMSIPSAILNAKFTNDVKIATYRSKINDPMASHEAESRELRQTIDDLERDNANLTERVEVLLEDIDDKHAISEYAQYIMAARANSSSGSSVFAAPESAYVLRLQSQLTKAMHKMGVLSNQIDLHQQQSDDAIADLRNQMMVQANDHAEIERQCLNDLVDMERDMRQMRQRFEEELTKRKEENRAKIHKLKDDARRWRDVAENLRRDNQALKKATAKASAAAAAAAKKSLEEKDDLTNDSVVSNKMLLDMQMEIIRLKKAHVAEIKMLREQASVKYADDGSAISTGAITLVSAEYQGRERSGSVDSDAATATSAATAQASNVSAKDYYHSRGRPVPASIVTDSAKSMSSSVFPIDEDTEAQNKSQEVAELQHKLMELAEHEGPPPMSIIVEAKKKRGTREKMTSALSSGTAVSSSASVSSSSAAAIAARSRLKYGRERQASSALIDSKVGRRRKETSSRKISRAIDEMSEATTSSASSKSRHSGAGKIGGPNANAHRVQGRMPVTRPRSTSPTAHAPLNSSIHDLHHSDTSLNYGPNEKKTRDEVPKEKLSNAKTSGNTVGNKGESMPSAKKHGSPGDSPTVPLVTLPERRSSIGRVA